MYYINKGLRVLMHILFGKINAPYALNILKLFGFFHFFSYRQLLLILDAINDSLNEDALLRSLKESHCLCFEK